MNTHNLSTIARILNSRWSKSLMPPVIYMTDELRAPNPLPTIKRLTPGSGVIFRHYNFKSRLNLGLDIKRLCQKKNLLFIIAGDCSLARNLNADGLHLPEFMVSNLTLQSMLWRKTPKKILTASAHCKNSLVKCLALRVDAALVSPVFPTNSHLDRTTLGVSKFQALAKTSPLPIYALGGINNMNAIQLINSPAIGIAGIGAVSQI